MPGSLWHTNFNNFAPRIGAAYQLTPKTVVRGGFSLFYDLGYGNIGRSAFEFPYLRERFISASPPLPFDLSNPAFQPPPFSTTIDANVLFLNAVDPNLRLPYTLQWNAAIERGLGANQALTATYVGSNGKRLLRQDIIYPPLLATKESFIRFSIVFAAAWWILERKKLDSPATSAIWIISSWFVSLATMMALHWWIAGHLESPVEFAASLHGNHKYLSHFASSLWDRNFWYAFLWLLPTGIPNLRRFPKSWLVPTGSGIGVGVRSRWVLRGCAGHSRTGAFQHSRASAGLILGLAPP